MFFSGLRRRRCGFRTRPLEVLDPGQYQRDGAGHPPAEPHPAGDLVELAGTLSDIQHRWQWKLSRPRPQVIFAVEPQRSGEPESRGASVEFTAAHATAHSRSTYSR
jgi:hypothetical protein